MSRINHPVSLIVAILLLFCLPVSTPAEVNRGVPKNLQIQPNEVTFNSLAFQSGIRGARGLGEIAKENTMVGEQAVSFAFAAKSEEAKNFIIGALYSEALAFLASGDNNLAADRLEAIEKEFINLNVPSSLFNHVSLVRNMAQTGRYPREVPLEVLSLFQPYYEDYAKSKGADMLTLFRAGSWLTDYSLSAAANDKALLRQPQKVEYFLKEMKRMDAPKGVIEAWEQIGVIAKKEQFTDEEVKTVLKLVKKIQTILA